MKTILLIDDDPIHQNLFSKMVEQCQTEVRLISAVNVGEALGLYRLAGTDPFFKLPDMIFIEVQISGNGAWDFLNAITKHPEIIGKADVLLMSSSIDNYGLQIMAHFPIVKDFLVKPLTLNFLNSIV